MVELTYLSLKKLLFLFVFLTYLPMFLFQFRLGELVGCGIWFRIIPHPTSTHTAYFWRTPLPQKKEIPEKTWWWCGYSLDAVWVLVGCGIKFCIQRALTIEIWVKTQGDMSKIRTKNSFFYDTYPQIYIKNLFKTYSAFIKGISKEIVYMIRSIV